MRKLSNWIGLVHKLRQLAAAKKFSNGAAYWTNIYKTLRGNFIGVLYRCHFFTDILFQSCHADTEIVLQKLTNRTHSSICKVINIVLFPKTVFHIDIVVYASYYIICGYMLINKLFFLRNYSLLQRFLVVAKIF